MTWREARYRDKISFIVEKIVSIPEDNFQEDLVRDAVFYKIHVGVEGIMDLAAMLVKDSGREVSDDYHNLEILKEEKIINENTCGKLKKLNGLRNVLVHAYNMIEYDLIFSNIDEIKKDILSFVEIVENVIQHKNS